MRPLPAGLREMSLHIKACGIDVGVFAGTFRFRHRDFADTWHASVRLVGIAVNMMRRSRLS